MKNNNLEFWNSVSETDPRFIKEVSYGKRQFHTVQAQYQIMKATEKFGMFGTSFGVKDPVITDIKFPAGEMLAIYQAKLWYKMGDNIGEVPIQSSIYVSKFDKNGNYTIDDEFVKKVSTDALTKGLSQLGFNADIFLGRYDDSRYVEEMTRKYSSTSVAPAPQQPQQATTKKSVPQKSPQEVKDWIAKCNTVEELYEVSGYMNAYATMYEPSVISEIEQLYVNRLKEIEYDTII
jgi:hypothetical protein